MHVCLNTGIPETINFPFGTNGKLMVLGAPIFKHFRVLAYLYVSKGRAIIVTVASASEPAQDVWIQGFYVMGKRLTGQLSYTLSALINSWIDKESVGLTGALQLNHSSFTT